jgi:hypothetical protein
MKHSVKKFNGEKEGYAEWFRTLKVELLQKGLFTVATNQEVRPTDVAPEMCHFDLDLQGHLAVLRNVTTSQKKWDTDNRKAYAAIINSLAETLQKRYDEVEEAESDMAHWLLADLNARYGGAYDPKIIALFLVESQKPIMPNTRFENWSAGWESLQRKMGYNIQQDAVHLLASMILVLAASGSNTGERFYKSLTFAKNSNYDYSATRDHLILQDELINSNNICNTSAVSFDENNIKRIDNVSQRDYHQWSGNNSGNQDINRSFENSGYNGKSSDSHASLDNSKNNNK